MNHCDSTFHNNFDINFISLKMGTHGLSVGHMFGKPFNDTHPPPPHSPVAYKRYLIRVRPLARCSSVNLNLRMVPLRRTKID